MVEIDKAIDHFENYLKNLRKSKRTIKNYKLDLLDFQKYLLGEKGKTILQEKDFKRVCLSYIDSLNTYEDVDEVKEYAPSSLNRKRTSMRMFIRFLKERDYISEDFRSQIHSIRKRKHIPDILTVAEIEEVDKLLNKEISEANTKHLLYIKMRNKLMFYLFLYLGVRVSELLKLKWEHIDFLKDEILIEAGKGDKPRVIPLKPELKLLIYSYKDVVQSISNDGRDYSGGFKGYIFYSNIRNKDISLNPKTAERVIKDLVKNAGIEKNITPHSLRHTMASHGIQSKMNIAVLASILGHSTPVITLDIYTHVISEEQRKEEMKKLSYR